MNHVIFLRKNRYPFAMMVLNLLGCTLLSFTLSAWRHLLLIVPRYLNLVEILSSRQKQNSIHNPKGLD
ncbi:hypothetical protein NC651_025819 [Populus alba x Populus x berolinensis]|nr:hypothetical protein NC651_025819 [Populus alba x Populus x berolinensis]